jgi:hypothetical protein
LLAFLREPQTTAIPSARAGSAERGSLIAGMQPHEYVGIFRVAANVFVHEAEGESVDDERIEGWMTHGGLRFTPYPMRYTAC